MPAGTVFGARYVLRSQLGEGGFGSVWRATDTRMKRDVAVKVLHVGGADVPRFTREAEVLARLAHPNIVTAFDFGADDGTAYLVLELLDGRSLADSLTAARPPVDQVLAIADQVLAGLIAAHAAGLVHRDLKPANIVSVGTGEHFKIVDFGIAHVSDRSRMTGTGVAIGTLRYMAPEQLNGDPIDGRADLYSLGCTMFELLTGESPFRASTPASWMHAHHFQEPTRLRDRMPAAPRELDDFIQRLLSKNPAGRPATATAARAELVGIRRSLAGAAPAASPTVVDAVPPPPTRLDDPGSGREDTGTHRLGGRTERRPRTDTRRWRPPRTALRALGPWAWPLLVAWSVYVILRLLLHTALRANGPRYFYPSPFTMRCVYTTCVPDLNIATSWTRSYHLFSALMFTGPFLVLLARAAMGGGRSEFLKRTLLVYQAIVAFEIVWITVQSFTGFAGTGFGLGNLIFVVNAAAVLTYLAGEIWRGGPRFAAQRSTRAWTAMATLAAADLYVLIVALNFPDLRFFG